MSAGETATISIIKTIMYVIAIVIMLITSITIINYVLYTIYSIQAIVKEQTYSDSPYFKQKDIYNYMLINYIHLLKKRNYNVTYTYHKSYDLVNLIDETDEGNKNILYNVNLAPYFNADVTKRINDFEKYKTYLEKNLITLVINNDKDYYISSGTNNYIIGETDDNPSIIIPNNVIEELNILHNHDTSYVLIQRGKSKGLDENAVDNAIGKYDMYKKNINNTQNIYGYFTKFIGEINPINLINMNDDKASYLYIHVNNSFYELVLMLIFIILLILFIKIIYSFYYNIIISVNNSGDTDGVTGVTDGLLGDYKNLSLILLVIIIYCLIHGIIYKYLFVNNVYDRVYEMYDELIKPDIYVASCINKYRKDHNFDDNVLDILKEVSHNGIINIYNTNQYTVVDYNKIEEVSIEKQLEEFNNIMLDINKNFSISNYSYNFYTNKLFTNIFKELNTLPTATAAVTTTEAAATTTATDADVEYKSSILLLLIIYIYFISNNKDDPYIIIKLNKLIFGTIANIGIPSIDKDIEYTLLLRSLVYEKLDIENMKTYITNINTGVTKWYQESKTDEPSSVKDKVDKKVEDFIALFATTNDNLDFWTPVYFLNLYLAVEIGLNLLLMLCILIIISTYSNSVEIEKYIAKVKKLINDAIEELKTAVIGVI